ncbi:hypothetical protein ACXYL9_03955 [Qipengyuania sp. CAU 1752]
MKLKNILIAAGLISLASLSPSATGAPAEGYGYLICRGGSDIRPIMQAKLGVMNIFIPFKSGTRGWNESNGRLEPGQCVWPDRPLNRFEPNLAAFAIPRSVNTEIDWSSFFLPLKRFRKRVVTDYAVQVSPIEKGVSIDILEPQGPDSTRPFENVMRIRFSENEYFTLAVKKDYSSTRSREKYFTASRILQGAVTGEAIKLNQGGKVEVR